MISIYELRLRYLYAGRGTASANPEGLAGMMLFDSGRSALFFLQDHLRERKGVRDVYVSPYTTDVVHRTLREAGCAVHPIDVNPLTFFPRLDDIDLHGAVFLQTGLFGFPCFDMGVRQRVRDAGGLFIEDSCNSFGSRIGTEVAGSVGEASIFSFRIGKALSTGGGALRVNDPLLERDLRERFTSVNEFSPAEARWRLGRAYLDYLAFEPWVLRNVSRPLRRMQRGNAVLRQFVKGGVVDTLTTVNAESMRKMSQAEIAFASRRLAAFDAELRVKREVSESLASGLARYPLFVYANQPEMRGGWNCLFFPVLLDKGDPDSFVDHLRERGFDASRFHHNVPESSFPGLARERFSGTFTLVDRLVCIPNTTRMAGLAGKLVDSAGEYFKRFMD